MKLKFVNVKNLNVKNNTVNVIKKIEFVINNVNAKIVIIKIKKMQKLLEDSIQVVIVKNLAVKKDIVNAFNQVFLKLKGY